MLPARRNDAMNLVCSYLKRSKLNNTLHKTLEAPRFNQASMKKRNETKRALGNKKYCEKFLLLRWGTSNISIVL